MGAAEFLGVLGCRFQRFFNWWTGRLIGSLPQAVAFHPLLASPVVVVEASENGWTATEIQGPITRMLNQDEIDRLKAPTSSPGGSAHAVWLSLPPDQVMVTSISLPRAVEARLRDVIAFDMDRLTPWQAADVLFDVVVVERSSNCTIRLAVSPRDRISKAVANARDVGFAVERAVLTDAEGRGWFDLTPGKAANSWSPRHFGRIILAALSFLVIVGPLWRLSDQASQLATRIDDARRTVTRLQATELQGRSPDAALTEIGALRSARPSAIVVLAELSKIFPDESYVREFVLRDRQLSLQGFSASPSKLLTDLEGSPAFEAVEFQSPLVVDASEQKTRVSIGMTLTAISAAVEPTP